MYVPQAMRKRLFVVELELCRNTETASSTPFAHPDGF